MSLKPLANLLLHHQMVWISQYLNSTTPPTDWSLNGDGGSGDSDTVLLVVSDVGSDRMLSGLLPDSLSVISVIVSGWIFSTGLS